MDKQTDLSEIITYPTDADGNKLSVIFIFYLFTKKEKILPQISCKLFVHFDIIFFDIV